MASRLPSLLVAAAGLSVDAVRTSKRLASSTMRASTSFGDVVGNAGGSCDTWMGIPFAEPPVGDLRFANPQPWQRAFPSGELDAQNPGNVCIQGDGQGDEDCLYLNIWRPRGVAAGAKLPVMVWIHGGAFTIGHGTESLYEGCNMAVNQDVIIVSFNYRLNIFGFGTFEEGGKIDANWGMEDQREALRWFGREIGNFGGDADKITIFGESAGGISIWHHMVTGASNGLFRAAIIQSGFPSAKELGPALAQTRDLGAKVGCGPENLKNCLRTKSPQDIQEQDDGHNILSPDVRIFQRWEPTEDGVELPSHPFKLLASGKSNPVPVIVGSNTDEGNLFTYLLYLLPLTNIQYRGLINDVWSNIAGHPSQQLTPAEVGRVLETYPGRSFRDNRDQLAAVSSDALFHCATRYGAKMHNQRSQAWTYRFNYQSSCSWSFPFTRVPGVYHIMEIPFVFNTSANFPFSEGCVPDAEGMRVSNRMQTYWANFAKYLDPNGNSASTWPAYTPGSQQEIVFEAVDRVESKYRDNFCSLWEDVLISKVL